MEKSNKANDDKLAEIFDSLSKDTKKQISKLKEKKVKTVPLEGYEGIRERPKFLDDFIEE